MGRHAGIRDIRGRGVRLPAERAREIWEAFLDALRVMSAIEASKLPDMPSAPAFIKKRKRDVDFDQRASAIMAQRKLDNSGRKRITQLAWSNFVNLVGTVCIRELCNQPGMPSEAAVYKKRKLDPAFDAFFANTFRQRRDVAIKGRLFARFPGMRLLLDRAQDQDWTVRETPVIDRSLQHQLAENDLYRTALAAVPPHINPNDRADIAADIVLAVLEGKLAIGEIPNKAKEFQRQHWRMFGTIGRISLDAPRFDDGPGTLGDTISNEQHQQFWAQALGSDL